LHDAREDKEVEMVATAVVGLTVGQIAVRLSTPLHKIEYLVRSRNISGIGRVGNLRVFGEDDVAFIAAELARINSKRERRVL
jgi:hypothetical protein